MKVGQPVPTTIDEYIALCPAEVGTIRQRICETTQKAAPDGEERADA